MDTYDKATIEACKRYLRDQADRVAALAENRRQAARTRIIDGDSVDNPEVERLMIGARRAENYKWAYRAAAGAMEAALDGENLDG